MKEVQNQCCNFQFETYKWIEIIYLYNNQSKEIISCITVGEISQVYRAYSLSEYY